MPLPNEVSIHALLKRATNNYNYTDPSTSSFNPRSPEESDVISLAKQYILHGSIHALLKRATLEEANKLLATKVSIHALVKRATNRPLRRKSFRRCFNPRSREESDLYALLDQWARYVSIHALVKRATKTFLKYAVITEFQSTLS